MRTDEAIRILGDTNLCTPLGQAAFVGIEALKEFDRNIDLLDKLEAAEIRNAELEAENTRLRAERDAMEADLGIQCKGMAHVCVSCKHSISGDCDSHLDGEWRYSCELWSWNGTERGAGE